ncbi:MAG: tol-pal system protein YbgF [Methyloprofundus sp.]|nr:tol-pal system protein YbgF [Methyloprofundus sp.]MBW6453282.1 tol-pal system protein YbgF [Methyloprofundus sp.]
MKNLPLILVLSIVNSVHAETRPLPPIINNSTYASGASYSSRATSNQPMLEMLARVESLQTELQQLRGLVEQQNYEMTTLKQRQQNIYADIDARLQRVETERGIAATVNTNAVISSQENLAIPAAQRNAAAEAAKPKPVVKSKETEKADFDKAFASVKNSHYQQAIKLLNDFLQDYPSGEYSDNATFWLASVYSVVKDNAAAKKNFETVFTQFPESDKASLSMLKLADIYLAENNTAKAKQLYAQIITHYANSTSAHMAEKKLQSMGQ